MKQCLSLRTCQRQFNSVYAIPASLHCLFQHDKVIMEFLQVSQVFCQLEVCVIGAVGASGDFNIGCVYILAECVNRGLRSKRLDSLIIHIRLPNFRSLLIITVQLGTDAVVSVRITLGGKLRRRFAFTVEITAVHRVVNAFGYTVVYLGEAAAVGKELRKLLRCNTVERDKNGIGLVRVFAEFFVT